MEDEMKRTVLAILLDQKKEISSLESPSTPSCYYKFLGRRGVQLILTEAKKQLWLAGPLTVATLLQFAIQVISLMFVGRLGELPFSGASMAFSFAGVTGYSLLLGTASALDILCGQAFGARKYSLLGIQMQSALLVITVLGIPVAIVWSYTKKILILFGQDVEIAVAAGLYAQWLIPALFAYGFLQCHIKFLQAQNIVIPIMLSTGITALFHILLCWTLVFKSGLGSKGAALSTGISYWINVLLLALYIKLSPACKSTWIGFSTEAFYDIIHFVKLAIPSAAMVCLDFWPFELLVLLPGRLPNPKLETTVQSISVNTFAILYMLQFGLGAAASTRISNELGAGYPEAARLAVKVVTVLAIAEGLFLGVTVILVRDIWGDVYSNVEDVVRHVAALMPILAASSLLDGLQCVLSGVVRGCGRQTIGSLITLGTFYIIGIPMAIILAFVLHMRGKGLWLGMACGIFFQALLLALLIIFTDWAKEARKAKDRVLNSTLEDVTST